MTAPSLNIDVTDEDEKKKIVHETLFENSSTDVSKSERNIVNVTLLQKHSADRPSNTITELKYKENQERSVTQKESSYFNIFECGRNILDQLDVTYQRAFTDTPEEKYYKERTKSLIKVNAKSGKL